VAALHLSNVYGRLICEVQTSLRQAIVTRAISFGSFSFSQKKMNRKDPFFQIFLSSFERIGKTIIFLAGSVEPIRVPHQRWRV
jgi:hypothetical protein